MRSRTRIPPPWNTQHGTVDKVPQYRSVVAARYASNTCFRLEASGNQDSTTVAYTTWYCRQSTSIQVFSVIIVLRIVLRLLYLSRTAVAAICATYTCFRLDAFENQDSTTGDYSTWYCRRNTALPVFPVVIALRIELRLLYPSSIVLVTRYVTDTCFRLDAFENQDSTTMDFSTWYCRRSTALPVFPVVIALRIELRLLYLSSIVLVTRYATDWCFRLDASENQDSTTVDFSTWYCRRNTALSVFPVVLALRIELRLLYRSSFVMVARYASDTCFRLDAFENQDSTTVEYSTWYCRQSTSIQVFSVVIVLRIVLRLLYLSRTAVAAICATYTCFRLDAFENQDSTTGDYSTWYCRRNTALPVFPVVIALRIELRLLYPSSIVLVTRYVTDTCFRLDAFENQDSTTMDFSTWYCRQSTSIQVFSVVIVLRTVLRLFYLSRSVVAARYATDTCFRLDASENQGSTTMDFSTWYCRRNTALSVFPVVLALRIELRLLYRSSFVMVARYASDTCFRLDAFENQDSTTVEYSTWYCRQSTSIQVFSVVIVLRIVLRLLYLSRTAVAAICATYTCFRLDAFENQDSTTGDYSTWYCRRNTALPVFPVVIALRIELRLLYPSSIVLVTRYVTDTCFRLDAFENQDSTTMDFSTWYCRQSTSIQVFSVVIVLRTVLRLFYLSRSVVAARYATDTCFRLDASENQGSTTMDFSTCNLLVTRYATDTCFRLDAFENQDSTTVEYSTWYCRQSTSIQEFSVVIVLRTVLRLFYLSRTVVAAICATDTCYRLDAFENQDSTTVDFSTCNLLVTRYATDTCFRLDAFENQDSTTVEYSTWYCRQSNSIQVFSVVIVLRTVLRLFYLSRSVVAARYATDTCFRLDAFENQDSTTVEYSTWYCRQSTSIQVFSVVIVLRTVLRLFYLSRTVVAAICATYACFRLDAFENQDSTTVEYSTWYCRQSTSIQVFSVIIVLRIVLRLFYISRTVVAAICATYACFRLDAFENQDSTTVAYSTWYCRRNTALPVFPVVIALRIELRMLYPFSVVLVTRCATDTCFRLDEFEYQDSSTVAYSTWYRRRNTSIQVFSIVIVLRIELRLLYLPRALVVARYASNTCFRLDAFENQDSTTVAYSTWYCRQSTSIQVFSDVIVLRIVLRLFYLSRTVVAAICATDTCYRLDAFENQDSTTMAYSTWYCRRNTALSVFPVVLALRIELRLLYPSSLVMVARYASDTCFRLDAFEIQDSTTVAYSTWYCRQSTSIQVFSVVIVLRIVLRLFYLSRTVVAAICATDTCYRLDAFENQDSTTVAYSTWYCRRNTALPVFPVVIALRIELRMLYPSSIVLVTRYATDTCFRLDEFEYQDSSTVAYSKWYCRRNTSIQVFPVVIALRIELRLLYPSSIVLVTRYVTDTCFRLDAFENQDSTTMDFSTWYCRRSTALPVFPVVIALRIELRLLYLSSIVLVTRYATDWCFRLDASENQDSTTVDFSTWYCRRNTALSVFPVVLALRIELRLLYPSSFVMVARYASDTCFRLDAFENQDSTTVEYSTWYCRQSTSIQVFSVVIVLRTVLRLFYLSRSVVAARYATDTCFRLDASENQGSTTMDFSTWYCRRNTALPVFPVVIALRIE
ncbi:hypothetical protein ANTQUA_LOCUS3465 [Anthophora quadrimaculata]